MFRVKRNKAKGSMEHHFPLNRLNLFNKRFTSEKEIHFSFRRSVILFMLLSMR
jgi:hypothetical protein